MRSGVRYRLMAAALAIMLASTLAAHAEAAEADVVSGWLLAVWGDSPLGSRGGSRLDWWLVSDAGANVRLQLDEEQLRPVGGPLLANGSRVTVRLEASADGAEPRAVLALLRAGDERLSPVPGVSGVTGAQPWVSLMCKFSDVAAQPRDLAYFQGMFSNAPGRLDHYWREASYNAANIVGSTAAGWVVLPHPQTHYVPTPGLGCLDGNPDNDADLAALFDDCTAAADSIVDFSVGGTGGFVGINLMFNSDLDGCAWGGGYFATLDGVTKAWRTTWEPPWGYVNVNVMAHEMGHGFGLPHSNNWDDDGWPYDNSWDVMSDGWSYTNDDLTYGVLGKHTIAFHKDLLGWIPPAQKLVAPTSGQVTFVIDDLALASTSNYRMAEIPVASGFDAWTVEVRGATGLYDGALPDRTVIIHQIDTSRSEAAWCFDADVPPGDEADGPGSMWQVGEVFEDAAHQVQVKVNAATANGYSVTIRRMDGNFVFADGFESGDAFAWTPSG